MAQKEIKKYEGNRYSVEEGAAMIEEFDRRTKSDLADMDSLQKAGNVINEVKTSVDNIVTTGRTSHNTIADGIAAYPNAVDGQQFEVREGGADLAGIYSIKNGVASYERVLDIQIEKNGIVQNSENAAKSGDVFIESQKQITGSQLGSFEGTNYPGNTRQVLYLSLKIQSFNSFESVEIDSNLVGGEILFVQYRETNGVFNLINQTPLISNKADISSFVFQKDDYVGTFVNSTTATGGVKFKSSGGSGKRIPVNGSLPNNIDANDLIDSGIIFSIKLIYTSVVDKKISAVQENLLTENKFIQNVKSFQRKIGNIVKANFRNSNLPNNWSANGFSSTPTGLELNGSPGINTKVQYDQYSNLDSFTCSFKFDMTVLSKILLTNYHKKLTSLGGHVLRFDFINAQIGLSYNRTEGTVPSSMIKVFDITIPIVLGKTSIAYKRDAFFETYTLTSGNQSQSFTYDSNLSPFTTGGGYDKFGLVLLEGNVSVLEGYYGSQMPSHPDVLIVGDSIVNGDTIRSLDGGGDQNRWAGKVAREIPTAIAALGGNNVGDVIRDLPFYLSIISPQKAVFGVGINDSDLNTFTSAAQSFITSCEQKNIEPIFETLHPRDGREPYCEQVSNWIKNSGYRYLDFRRVLTVDGMGTNRISSLFLPDNLHPNVAGHAVMFNESKLTLDI